MTVLVTCPPMLRSFESVRHRFDKVSLSVRTPDVVQTLAEAELVRIVPEVDGWIIGDDPATRKVFESGKRGKLKAVVKWGVGIDNVDFAAARELGIPIAHTPGMFGAEVADIAVSYVVALARETFLLDRGVRAGLWPKPVGMSLAGRQVALVGFGDIGRNVAKRLLASDMRVTAYDPFFKPSAGLEAVERGVWPNKLEQADFIVFACALTSENRHMLNGSVLAHAKQGVRIVNVARGPLIDEAALVDALRSGKVHSAALDVFEEEPLSGESPLRSFDKCVFGSHNSSNTLEAVIRTSHKAIDLMFEFLQITD